MHRSTISLWAVAFALVTSCLRAQSPSDLERQYSAVVQPLLKKHCAACHSGPQSEAMLDLDRFTSTEQVAASHQTWAELAERVAKGEMPPADAQVKLSAADRDTLVQWIGAFRKSEAEKHAGEPAMCQCEDSAIPKSTIACAT